MRTFNQLLVKVVLIFALFILIFQVTAIGNVTVTQNDSFSITVDNSLNATGWNLKYPASDNGFKITMLENNGEKEFTVRSKFFEIVYLLNKNGFGARMVRPGKAQVPAQILDQVINMEALKQQKVVSDPSIDNETALNLIASYLPDLLNINYKQLAR